MAYFASLKFHRVGASMRVGVTSQGLEMMGEYSQNFSSEEKKGKNEIIVIVGCG